MVDPTIAVEAGAQGLSLINTLVKLIETARTKDGIQLQIADIIERLPPEALRSLLPSGEDNFRQPRRSG
jgi:hypothetical protein